MIWYLNLVMDIWVMMPGDWYGLMLIFSSWSWGSPLTWISFFATMGICNWYNNKGIRPKKDHDDDGDHVAMIWILATRSCPPFWEIQWPLFKDLHLLRHQKWPSIFTDAAAHSTWTMKRWRLKHGGQYTTGWCWVWFWTSSFLESNNFVPLKNSG